MTARVHLHIGMPKTGTTYLQDIVWSHRDRLLADGVMVPGRGHREHLWAALDLQERPRLARRHVDAPGSFDRLAAELAASDAPTGLITHEFMCAADADQAADAVRRLAPAQVHVVVTARDTAGMLAAGWQEMVKNGSTLTAAQAASGRRRPDVEFSWATWDLAGILERWGAAVPAERIHVVTMPRAGAPRRALWEAYAGVLGVPDDEGAYEAPERVANPSLGAVEVELLRRLNHHLGDFMSPTDRGRWIRGHLAERRLRAERSAPFALSPELLEECRTRSARAVELIESRGVDLVGDAARLLPPATVGADGRQVDDVSDGELLDAAGRLVASLLDDVRRQATRGAERHPDPGPGPVVDDSVRARLLRRLAPRRGR